MKKLMLVAVFALWMVSPACAFIVDTGVTSQVGWGLSENTRLGKFEVTSQTTISSLEAYYVNVSNFDYLVSFAVYGDTGWPAPFPTPLASGPDFSTTFLAATALIPAGQQGYIGVDDQFILDPGSYWFETGQPGTSHPFGLGLGLAQVPLELYGTRYDTGQFSETDQLKFALRVGGVPVIPNPEPATLALFGGGLITLVRRRSQRRC